MFTHAVPMLEVVDHVTPDRDPNAAVYRMLTGALRTLGNPPLRARHDRVLLEAAESRRVPPAARRVRALWRRRVTSRCAPSISPTAGCCATRAPRSRGAPSRPKPSTLLRRLLGGGLNEALSEPPGPVTREVERLGLAAVEHHLERRLRSATLL